MAEFVNNSGVTIHVNRKPVKNGEKFEGPAKAWYPSGVELVKKTKEKAQDAGGDKL